MYDLNKLDLVGRDGRLIGERSDAVLRTAMSFAAVLTPRAPVGGLIAGWWRRFAKDFARPYRPELHYMRGPGPKWREKHGGPGVR